MINHEIFLCSSIKEGDIWMKKYVDIDISHNKYENYDQSFLNFQNYLDDIAEKASFELMDYSKKSLGLTFSGDIDAKKHILKIFIFMKNCFKWCPEPDLNRHEVVFEGF